MSDDSVRLVDLRNIIAGTDEKGHKLDPRDDMVTTLFDVINMAELESAQRAKEIEEVSAGGSDNDDNASQCSAGSRWDEPHPGYRVEPRLAGNEQQTTSRRPPQKQQGMSRSGTGSGEA